MTAQLLDPAHLRRRDFLDADLSRLRALSPAAARQLYVALWSGGYRPYSVIEAAKTTDELRSKLGRDLFAACTVMLASELLAALGERTATQADEVVAHVDQ